VFCPPALKARYILLRSSHPAPRCSNPYQKCHQKTRQVLMQVIIKNGGVGERLKPAVLKTVRPERVSGVRIPPPPPASLRVSPFPIERSQYFNFAAQLLGQGDAHSFRISPQSTDALKCGRISLNPIERCTSELDRNHRIELHGLRDLFLASEIRSTLYRTTCNQRVVGRSPTAPTKLLLDQHLK
jgi:hypothetical protein